jgi:hypothetical protein
MASRVVSADTIYSNFGPAFTDSGNAISLAGNNYGGEYYALAFTPSLTETFTDVLTALVFFTGQNSVGASLLTTLNGLPGTTLATLSQSTPITSGVEKFVCLASCPQLLAGTEYWLQLKESDPNTSIGWYLSSNDFSSSTNDVLRFTYYDPNSPIYTPSGQRPVFEIDGVSTTVPEPGGCIQLFTGLMILACLFCYQRKANTQPWPNGGEKKRICRLGGEQMTRQLPITLSESW